MCEELTKLEKISFWLLFRSISFISKKNLSKKNIDQSKVYFTVSFNDIFQHFLHMVFKSKPESFVSIEHS